MNEPGLKEGDPVREELARQGLMRQDLLRASTAVATVLMVVLGLALVAIFTGVGAARNLQRAQVAESASRDRLRQAYTEEARAIRASAEAGSRAAALSAISNAVAIRPSPELRTEAVACLALSDLVPEGAIVPTPSGLTQVEIDAGLRYFAYGDDQGNVLVHRLTDGRQVYALAARQFGARTRRPVDVLAFSPDGALLSARFRGGALVVWRLGSDGILFSNAVSELPDPSLPPSAGLSFSPDSRRLIFGDPELGGRIVVGDLASGERQPTPLAVAERTFKVRPDLRQVAVASNTCVTLLGFPSGLPEQTLLQAANVDLMEWSPDGQCLAVSCDDGDVYLWDLERHMARHFVGHSERCVRLNFSPDGTLLLSSSRDGTTRFWDVTLGRMVAVGQGLGHIFTSDSRRIGFWRPWEGFGIWRLSPSSVYAIHPCDKSQGPLVSLDLSPSGRWAVVTQRKGFRLWDLAAGDRETFVPGAFTGVRVSMDERSLAVCSERGLETWPLATNRGGDQVFPPAAPGKIPLPDGLGAHAVALSRNGHWALVELVDRRMYKIDLVGGAAPLRIPGLWRTLNAKGAASPTGSGRYAISPDGRWIATGFDFEGGAPKVWDGLTGELAAALPEDTSIVGFSPDGRWLGLSGMSRYSLWSVGDWRLHKSFARDEASLVHGAMAFSADSPTLAVSRTRQKVQLWDWPAAQKICDLIPPLAQSVNSVRWSEDGQTLVMATATDMLEVWRLNELHRALAERELDWGGAAGSGGLRPLAEGPRVSHWPLIVLTSAAAFVVTTLLALLTLRRHRRAIERFVIAEAEATQRNRELDLAKIELMHSQKMQALGTLATGIAHDFNNLLSVVRMSNKLIGRQAAADREIQEYVADIEQAVLQGKSVVGSMLGYARADAAPGELTDVAAVVEEAITLLSREFLSGIELDLALDPDLPKVAFTRSSLSQILLNLLVNAAEAMQGQGRLRIQLRSLASLPGCRYALRPPAATHYLELSMRDSGPGIAPELRDRLFEPFFTTKRGGARVGTGLGLSLVYSLAQQAGLGLAVESDPGQGAQFTVVFPIGLPPVRDMHSANRPALV